MTGGIIKLLLTFAFFRVFIHFSGFIHIGDIYCDVAFEKGSQKAFLPWRVVPT